MHVWKMTKFGDKQSGKIAHHLLFSVITKRNEFLQQVPVYKCRRNTIVFFTQIGAMRVSQKSSPKVSLLREGSTFKNRVSLLLTGVVSVPYRAHCCITSSKPTLCIPAVKFVSLHRSRRDLPVISDVDFSRCRFLPLTKLDSAKHRENVMTGGGCSNRSPLYNS